MGQYNWKQFAATAKEHSGGPTLPEADGYTSEIVDAGAKEASGKPTRFWWKHKVIVGPHAGATEIQSQQLNPDNPNALAMFYRVLGNLGIDLEQIPDGTPPTAVAKTAVGRRFTFDFRHRVDTKDKSENPRKFADFQNLVALETVTATAPTAPVAPVVPAAAPVQPAAPLQVEADAPATVNTPSVEELLAQVAALQAQQAAPAAAPAAEAPKSNVPF